MGKQFDFLKNEHEVLKLWDKINVFQKMVEKNKNSKERYRHLDGPITANGSMCMHHVWGRTLKDAQIKYNTLKGRSCQYQNGFDAQGMWVEVEVEKLLGLNDKKAILDYGLDNFTEKCIERVNHFAAMQTKQSIRLGQLMDWDNSYFTNSDHNITSIWHFLKICHQRGMLVKSYKSMPWCPRCGTSLSEHEMAGQYKELTHKSVFARARLLDGKHKGSELLIWTTTPWTLSANVAIAVNPENDYVKVKVKSSSAHIIIGKEAAKKVLKGDLVEVIAEFKGSELVDAKFTPVLNIKMQTDFDHRVILWSDVDAKEGTGAVHIAPGCGSEDWELSKIHNLKVIVPINDSGIFTEEFEVLAGMDTVAVEEKIFELLTQNATLYKVEDYTHNYPFCWRCKTNVVFRVVDGWDIATEELKPQLIEAARKVKWQPAHLLKSMENWLQNMGNWNISRRRFYGLPLPFYPCACGQLTVVGSLEELKEVAVDKSLVDKIPHLHRPYIDEIEIRCSDCGASVKRVPEVGDCWLDAGIVPFSTKRYFTDKEYFNANFPSEVVIEGNEQIRLWFYSMLFMSVVLTGKAQSPYEKLVGYCFMVNEDGSKFSKSGPNNIPFDKGIELYSADASRYTCCIAPTNHEMRFGPGLIDASRRKLLALYNSYQFFRTYFEIDKPDLSAHKSKDLDITDQWLIATLNKYVEVTDKAYSEHKIHLVVQATEEFVEDLSNFYIRTNRRRFWKGEGQDKLNAYWVLYQAIKSIAVVMAPIVPFISENIWQGMVRVVEKNAPESIMLANYPGVLRDVVSGKDILSQVEFIKEVASIAHSLRAREGIKVRRPIGKMFVKAAKGHAKTIELFESYLVDELNIKEVELVTSDTQFNDPFLTVDFKKAGAVLKGEVQALKNALTAMSDADMAKAVAGFNKGKVTIGKFKDLDASLFERKLKSKSEFIMETVGEITVVLDTTQTQELKEEGSLRELIRTIQVARQEVGLEITDRISLGVVTSDAELKAIVAKFQEKIATETLATTFGMVEVRGGKSVKADVDGVEVVVYLKSGA